MSKDIAVQINTFSINFKPILYFLGVRINLVCKGIIKYPKLDQLQTYLKVYTNKQTFPFISIFYKYNFVIVSWLGAFWRQMKIKHLGRDFMSVCAISCVGTCWSWASSTVHCICILILNPGRTLNFQLKCYLKLTQYVTLKLHT